MTDFAARRTMMVDTQVRPNDVTKFPIIEAMLTIPRELFLPEGKREAAYVGENIGIAAGRVLLEPRTLAKMLDALDLQPSDHVLDIAGGSGYSAAVMARMAASVVAVEDDIGLADAARAQMAVLGAANASVVTAALGAGAAAQGPYDAILIGGAAEVVPVAITDQLKEGGRIACLFMDGVLGQCRIGRKIDGKVSWRFGFNAAAPVLPGFAAQKDFVL